jgi:hypothetical protein
VTDDKGQVDREQIANKATHRIGNENRDGRSWWGCLACGLGGPRVLTVRCPGRRIEA